MAEVDYSNTQENTNKVDDIANVKQKATNELYFYISNELSKNYYNYIDLLNNKNAIIQGILEKYNITDDKDILYFFNKYDYFYRKLKNQADELRKQKMKGISILVNIICWIIFLTFVGLILA